MIVIKKDILSVEEGIICHQVNCLGIMGGGLALQIKNKYPLAYQDYLHYLNEAKNYFSVLGSCHVTHINNKLSIAHLFGQDGIGNGKQTKYWALAHALTDLNQYNKQLYIPYKMGCGLGGGNWNIVQELIYEQHPSAFICKV